MYGNEITEVISGQVEVATCAKIQSEYSDPFLVKMSMHNFSEKECVNCPFALVIHVILLHAWEDTVLVVHLIAH